MKNHHQPKGYLYPFLFASFIHYCLLLFIPGNAWSQHITALPGDDQVYNTSPAPAYAINTYAVTKAKDLAVVFTQHPVSIPVCEHANAFFSVVATGGGPLTYQWQESTNGGGTWTTLGNTALYSGTNTDILQITDVPFSMNNYQYRCIVSDGLPNTSNPATLTVNPAPVVQTVDQHIRICEFGSTTFNLGPVAGIDYQWQASPDSGITWADIADGGPYTGTGTPVLDIFDFAGLAPLHGYEYRFRATNPMTGCADTSTGVIHLFVVLIRTQPAVDTTVCEGNTAVFTSIITANETMNYQWRFVSTNTPVIDDAVYSGATTPVLTVANTTLAMNGQLYYLYVSNNIGCSNTGPPVYTTVAENTAITAQPQNAIVCANTNAVFNVSAGGTSLTYQWQTDNGTAGVTWSDISSGGTGTTLTLNSVTVSMSGYRYRVKINGTCGTDTSAAVILAVISSGTWLGIVDTNWHVAGNWCGGVPTSTTDVLIPNWAPRMPTISNTTGTAFWQSLSVENTAILTISGGTTPLAGPAYNILGTVAYTANADQPVLPANHGSLQVNGSGNKLLQANVDISNNLALGGAARLVTDNYILNMKNGSNPISGAGFGASAGSWIVTGNGSSGAANTGRGGLRIEQLNAADGPVLFPVGPTALLYNPMQLTNSGVTDDFTVTVNDQAIPGSVYESGIYGTWLLSEGTPGGSSITMGLQWQLLQERSAFDRSISEIIRSDGTMIVENSATSAATGSDPYVRTDGPFTTLTQFSVASYVAILPVKLLSFQAQPVNSTTISLNWKVDPAYSARSYTVQKSTNGTTYSNIGTVAGENKKITYGFLDNSAGTGATYYRLKMMSYDDKIVYSQVISLRNRQEGIAVELRPSFTRLGFTNLYVTLDQPATIRFFLTDVAGRVQLGRAVQLGQGKHALLLPLEQVSKGIYYVYVTDQKGNTCVRALVKQ